MSSSNLVRVAFIPEVTYGVTPGAGNFSTARFTSEGLSGTPDTAESQQIRTDRMSSGQVVVGLQVAGELQIELAKENALDLFLESAMYNTWSSIAAVVVDLDIDATAKTITRAAGSFVSEGIVVGDFISLVDFTDPANNVQVMATVVTALVITYVGPTLVDETGTGTSYRRYDKLTIGTTKKSFSMVKQFLDLTTKGINYRGMIVNQFDLNFAHGELATGSLAFSGNDYQTADSAAELITDGRTINAPATSQTLNGSIDMPFLASSATGALATGTLALQSVSMSLNNNLNAQNVIGDIAPIDYSAGTAAISMDLSAYSNDSSWAILAKKLTQEAFALAFQVKNADGAYAFYFPQVQVSFEDPSSGGQNQDILLSMQGVAKVGATGESAMSIYRSN